MLLLQEIAILGDIDPDFEYTGKSAVHTDFSLLRGKLYGGVFLVLAKKYI